MNAFAERGYPLDEDLGPTMNKQTVSPQPGEWHRDGWVHGDERFGLVAIREKVDEAEPPTAQFMRFQVGE